MATGTGSLRIGTSGYQYDHWQKRFYPEDVPKKDWFDFYAARFDSVEINNTFYSLPQADTFQRWREAAPEGFQYSLKFSRYGSHIKKLKDPDQTIATFLEVARELGPSLGPILVQLPPRWRPDPDRLDAFLRQAPRRHRWVIEVRDPAWLKEDIYAVLRQHSAALCIHDMIKGHPAELTADWTYLRFHGRQYRGSYSPQYLSARADWIAGQLRDGRDVYVYFNNDEDAHAPHNARDLKRYVDRRL